MAVQISSERKAVVLTYDTDAVDGDTADVRCTNPNDLSDVSTVDDIKNDGNVVVTFPADYHGESQVVVTGSDGGEDTGTVEV